MPEVELSGDDCSHKSTTTLVVGIGTETRRYFFGGSRHEEMDEAVKVAKAKAEGELLAKAGMPTCAAPCKPFILMSGHNMTVDIDDGSTWWSLWLWYWVKATVKISCDVVVGCSK